MMTLDQFLKEEFKFESFCRHDDGELSDEISFADYAAYTLEEDSFIVDGFESWSERWAEYRRVRVWYYTDTKMVIHHCATNIE